ncbi:hypothetical protein [Commensalibacter papalotli (ex Servin-Garciduenas et al. 2014)]|nr:hypothetical protein [Commensalibacter papalotli (ex Servin-Garciduenas et al. 2014)]
MSGLHADKEGLDVHISGTTTLTGGGNIGAVIKIPPQSWNEQPV